MKLKERKICVKNPRLRQTRALQRVVLIDTVHSQIRVLQDLKSYYLDKVGPDTHFEDERWKKVDDIQDEIVDLRVALQNSICICKSCSKVDKDMVYLPYWKAWYCVDCQHKMKKIDIAKMEARQKFLEKI